MTKIPRIELLLNSGLAAEQNIPSFLYFVSGAGRVAYDGIRRRRSRGRRRITTRTKRDYYSVPIAMESTVILVVGAQMEGAVYMRNLKFPCTAESFIH